MDKMERRRSKTDTPLRAQQAANKNQSPSSNSPRTHFTAINLEDSFTEETQSRSHHSGSHEGQPELVKKSSVYLGGTKLRASSISQNAPLINIQSSLLARNRTTFTYPILAQIGGAEKWLGNVSAAQGSTQALNEHGKGAPKKDEGFFLDLERKGFEGIWGHPITRLYFLMYLIWNGYESIYVLRSELLEFRDQYHSFSSSSLRFNFFKKLKRGFFTEGSLFYIDWPPNISEPTVQEIMDRITTLADISPANIYDDLAFISIRTLQMVFENQQFASMHEINLLQASQTLGNADKGGSDQELKKANSSASPKPSSPNKGDLENSGSNEALDKKVGKEKTQRERQQSLITVEENTSSPLLAKKKKSKQENMNSPLMKRKKKRSQTPGSDGEKEILRMRPLSPTEAEHAISEDAENVGASAKSKLLSELEPVSSPTDQQEYHPEPPASESFPNRSPVSLDMGESGDLDADQQLKPAPPSGGRQRTNSGNIRVGRRSRLLSNDSGRNQPISNSSSVVEFPNSPSKTTLTPLLRNDDSSRRIADLASSVSESSTLTKITQPNTTTEPMIAEESSTAMSVRSDAATSGPIKLEEPKQKPEASTAKALPKIDTRTALHSLKYRMVNSLRVSFQESGFYQALRNDFRGTAHITDTQCIRAIERIRDLCRSTKMEISKYEVFVALLEDFKLEMDVVHQKRGKTMSVQSSTVRLDEASAMTPGAQQSILVIQV